MFLKPEEIERSKVFQRNDQLEQLLKLLNGNLNCAEQQLLVKSTTPGPDFPIVFVMGPLRSGTTLFMQWLANLGLVAYPTNLMSRFYGVPLVGAYIQLLLTDPHYNFRNEIFDFAQPISFESENGKTRGALAPNEFWYFWRRFLPFGEIDWLPDEKLFKAVDIDTLVAELSGLTRIFSKPFALKGMILNYNIPFLDSIFEKALFVQTKRDPVSNVASIMEARKRQLGSEHGWYSFKIPEFPILKNLDPLSQSAGQLHYINAAVSRGMSLVDDSRKIEVEYEHFCEKPKSVFNEISRKLGLNKNIVYTGPESFKVSRNISIPNLKTIQSALEKFQHQ